MMKNHIISCTIISNIISLYTTSKTNTRYLHPHSSLLAKKLSDLLPGSLDVVFFVNSGSEANDLALRLARAYNMQQMGRESSSDSKHTRKDCIITIDHGYHGHTLATLDVSPYKWRQGNEINECPDCVRRVPCPDVYRGIHSVKRNAQQSNVDTKQQYCKSVREAAEKYASYVEQECNNFVSQGQSVSAFIMDGGMSVAGFVLPPQSYLHLCVDAVRKAGGLYIAD